MPVGALESVSQPAAVVDTASAAACPLPRLPADSLHELRLPDKLLQQWCLDIVTSTHRTCNCFTKAYSHYSLVRLCSSASLAALPTCADAAACAGRRLCRGYAEHAHHQV